MYVSPETDQLPSEPRRVRASTGPFAVRVVLTGLRAVLVLVLSASLWPLFGFGVLVWGWPPHQPRLSAIGRYLRLVWTVRPPEPGLAPLSRVYLSLVLAQRLALVPVAGLAWYLDEVLYGRRLAATPVRQPLILLSAARSGSTQLSRYLEEDPRLVAPNTMQCVFPYLWLWRLVAPTLGRWVPRSWVQALLERLTTEEFVQRHEVSPFHTDTLEVLFYANKLPMLAFCLGPEVIVSDFCPAHASAHCRSFWERDFVDYVGRLGRKTLCFHARPDGPPRRLYIKGHFQAADDALAARFPDAHFLTVVRDPVRRLPSVLNHLHANPSCEPLGAVPWTWLAQGVPEAEAEYCDRELAWFTGAEGPERTVIRFSDYTRDLQGTMMLLGRACFGDEELPDRAPREHAPRERRNYRVNRSLDDLGIDAEAYAARLADYRAWSASSQP